MYSCINNNSEWLVRFLHDIPLISLTVYLVIQSGLFSAILPSLSLFIYIPWKWQSPSFDVLECCWLRYFFYFVFVSRCMVSLFLLHCWLYLPQIFSSFFYIIPVWMLQFLSLQLQSLGLTSKRKTPYLIFNQLFHQLKVNGIRC